jgi:hypothetical protein
VQGEMEKENIKLTAWKIIFLIESAAVMIALAMTITPSKTGSDWSPVELFFENPSFWQDVLIHFIAVNLLIGIFALIFFLSLWIQKRRKSGVSSK